MSLNKDGEQIISIFIGKKKVIVKFSSFKMNIPFDVYTSLYLYEGKLLTNEEINSIEEMIKNDKYNQYAKKLVFSHLYSEKQIKDKLLAKGCDLDSSKKIVATLKEAHLLDDKTYLENAVSTYLNKGYGRKRIMKLLLEKGLKEDDIINALPSIEDEYARANKLLDKLEKKYSSINYASKKKKIYSSLLRNGYDHQVALKVLENIKANDYETELNLLRKDYKKQFLKNFKKCNNLELAKSKTLNYLLGKGYLFKDIKYVEEEFDNESRMD